MKMFLHLFRTFKVQLIKVKVPHKKRAAKYLMMIHIIQQNKKICNPAKLKTKNKFKKKLIHLEKLLSKAGIF